MSTEYIEKVESLLGGMGTMVHADGTEHFCDPFLPEKAFSPRLEEAELEAFCRDNLHHYQAFHEANRQAIEDHQELPDMERFWEQ